MFLDVLVKAGRLPGPFTGGLKLLPPLRGAGYGLLVLLGLAANAFAQTPSTSRAYRVVAGDVLQVDVVGRSDISGQYSVNKEGDIALPVLGSVTAAGRTTTELSTDISRRISLTSRDIPQVTVSVVQAYRRKNHVLGAVLLPGSFTFAKSPTVWEAISEAGGPSDDADLSKVEIHSESQIAPTIFDLAAAVQAGDLASLPRLRPGDTIRVPRREGGLGVAGNVVYVFGAVGAQGSQPISEASDLVRAVIRSLPAIDANLTNVEIVRRSGPRVVSIRVNLRNYLQKASLVGNPELQSGDTIYLTRKDSTLGIWRIAGLAVGLTTSIAIVKNNF